MHQNLPIINPTPPAAYPRVAERDGFVRPLDTGLASLIGGAAIGGGDVASKKLGAAAKASPPAETPVDVSRTDK